MIRDQFNDPAFSTLYNLLENQPDALEFVKTAKFDDDKGAGLPDTAFAWPEQRRFPIHDAQSTVLSSLYRNKTAAAVPTHVDDMLKQAQNVYGVKDVVAKALERDVKQMKTAAAAVEPVYVLPKLGRLRIKQAADVKVAERLLLDQYSKLGLEDRAEGFSNLVKIARDHSVTLEPKTHQMAGMTVCTTKVAMDFIEARRCATKEPLFQEAYEKIAAAFRNRGKTITDRDELVKVADAIAKLDSQANITHLYDKKLLDPIQTVFNTQKLAEAAIDIAGRNITLRKLAEMPATFWGDLLGSDVTSVTNKTGQVDQSKLAQVVPTLPLDLKIILKNQIPA